MFLPSEAHRDSLRRRTSNIDHCYSKENTQIIILRLCGKSYGKESMSTFEEAFFKKATYLQSVTAVLIPKAEQSTLDITILVKVRSCYSGIRLYYNVLTASFIDEVEKKVGSNLPSLLHPRNVFIERTGMKPALLKKRVF
jgi:hypothetical protein